MTTLGSPIFLSSSRGGWVEKRHLADISAKIRRYFQSSNEVPFQEEYCTAVIYYILYTGTVYTLAMVNPTPRLTSTGRRGGVGSCRDQLFFHFFTPSLLPPNPLGPAHRHLTPQTSFPSCPPPFHPLSVLLEEVVGDDLELRGKKRRRRRRRCLAFGSGEGGSLEEEEEEERGRP